MTQIFPKMCEQCMLLSVLRVLYVHDFISYIINQLVHDMCTVIHIALAHSFSPSPCSYSDPLSVRITEKIQLTMDNSMQSV